MEKKIGRQEPTTSIILAYTKTRGQEAVDLYELTGNKAHPWEQALVYDIMAINEDGQWVHTKFGFAVPRQNGKGEILIIRELHGLAMGEHILHTAHRVSTSHSAFERLKKILESLGLVKDRDYHSIKAKGQEIIELKEGGKIEFRTRTNTGGLGESYDLLVIDEAQEYQTAHETALKYVIAASKNPQTIMCGTPPTAVSSGTVFKNLRDDVLAGAAGNTGWAEWSVEKISEIFDKELWYRTNPSLGLTLKERTVADELGTSEESRIDFNIQRLGLWLEYNIKSAISRSAWDAVSIREFPELEGPLAVGIKYNKDGVTVCLAIAAHTRDGKIFTEVAGRHKVREGPGWIISFIRNLGDNITQIAIDGKNGQEILKDELMAADLQKPHLMKIEEVIEAAQRFENGIYQGTICHMEQPSLANVVANCEHRAIGTGGGFGYRPINDLLDISLMESVMLAYWAAEKFDDSQIQGISY